ncbi:hypothetical protein [uncultured Litoreibacter sp.]|uniref:hypothetical protein n=1 Tax=uncultured Litoreibacter sp. TaxID=1392394 RepID=UPI002631A082|nr:hypothetical protein [uncultured Litoreibacter sp.]
MNDIDTHSTLNDAKYPVTDHSARLGVLAFIVVLIGIPVLSNHSAFSNISGAAVAIVAVVMAIVVGLGLARIMKSFAQRRQATYDAEIRAIDAEEKKRKLSEARKSGDLDRWNKTP